MVPWSPFEWDLAVLSIIRFPCSQQTRPLQIFMELTNNKLDIPMKAKNLKGKNHGLESPSLTIWPKWSIKRNKFKIWAEICWFKKNREKFSLFWVLQGLEQLSTSGFGITNILWRRSWTSGTKIIIESPACNLECQRRNPNLHSCMHL